MNKIRILFYTELWANAGIESVIMSLYRNIDLNKYYVDIMASQNLSDFYDTEIERLGGQKYITLSHKVKSPFKRMITNLSEFRNYVRNNHYDIVHLHMCNAASMIYGYIAKKNGVKIVVYHSHNTNLSSNNRLIKTFAHHLCKHTFEKYGNIYLSCSDLASNWMFRKSTVCNGKIYLLRNGIDLTRFRYDKNKRQLNRLEINVTDEIVIGHIGRFDFAKNHDFLIDVFYEFHKQNNNSVLLLVGEGDNMTSIKSKVEKLCISDSVIFYGTTNKIPELLFAMDVFLLPSFFEGNPVVGIEAQAASLPCFFSDTITRMCQLTNNVQYLSINSNPKIWADAIINCLKIYQRKDSISLLKGKGYDIKEVANFLMTLYENEIKK